MSETEISESGDYEEPIRQSNHVRFATSQESMSRRSSTEYSRRPTTAPSRVRTWDGERGSGNPAFLRPNLKTKQKSSPVDLYHQVESDFEVLSDLNAFLV